MKLLHSTNEFLKPFQMADQWLAYVKNFDTLMQEALKVCVRNSLQRMFEALHGDGTTTPSPILKLFANLKHNRVFSTLDYSY